MKIQKIVFLLWLLPSSIYLFAQQKTSPFESEKSTGYRGNDIPELRYYDDGFSFLVLGDFGRVGDYYQKDVARELGNAAIVSNAECIISVGDNFYPNGVASTQDHHWKASFEEIYNNPGLYTDWFVALGNHDYQGSIQAQIEYSSVSRRWNMPATYYSKTFTTAKGEKLLMLFIDTNPFIDSYYKNPQKYPDLAKQDTITQRKWIEETLNTSDPAIKWKVVVGHHPLYSGGKRKNNKDTASFESKFADLFDQYKVDAYICGHEHDLQIVKPKKRYTTQFLSGAGSEVRETGNREGTVFAAAEPGFMTFTIVKNKMIVQTVKANPASASVLHTYEITK
ncbi:metallophosphoesterase [Myroides ceti]|uniref:Metallophosphoesterase n=1 Tax=Paenimyroides ceti TaxID=395087 RepID=A0ABT8CNV3_9FLAO|nr:metallophosphoesterase [Paenimyroides ceti]MDN3705995.1 metallophosphoesterase [Paenimyroides ceti]